VARAIGVSLIALAFSFLLGTGSASAACQARPTPVAENAYWKNADASTNFPLCQWDITSATSDGLSLFALDPSQGAVVQLQIAGEGKFNRLTPANLPPSPDGVLLLGPRAFYAVQSVLPTDPTQPPQAPWLYRADRVPTAMRGGWKALRHIAGPADLGLAAVAMNSTIWMLRSDSDEGFRVDWQPVASDNNEQLAPPGPTVNLGTVSGNNQPREAAGVTATKDSIYVFGGKSLPFEAIRIPLVNGAPSPFQRLGPLPFGRAGATALVHASSVYLVGGNLDGGPTIQRAPILRDGSLGRWESYPEPPPGATIKTALFARDYLWIFREDGSLQKSRIGGSAYGRARVVWQADTRPYVVTRDKLGQDITIPIKWTYDGPRELTGLSAAVGGSFVDNSAKPRDPIARLVDANGNKTTRLTFDPALVLSPDPDATGQPRNVGPDLSLVVKLPNDPKRTEYLVLVQLFYSDVTTDGAGKLVPVQRSLGPLIRFRFVVKRNQL
jgi:hypothetical protein